MNKKKLSGVKKLRTGLWLLCIVIFSQAFTCNRRLIKIGVAFNNSSRDIVILMKYKEPTHSDNISYISRGFRVSAKQRLYIASYNIPELPPQTRWQFDIFDNAGLTLYKDSLVKHETKLSVAKGYRKYYLATYFATQSEIMSRKVHIVYTEVKKSLLSD